MVGRSYRRHGTPFLSLCRAVVLMYRIYPDVPLLWIDFLYLAPLGAFVLTVIMEPQQPGSTQAMAGPSFQTTTRSWSSTRNPREATTSVATASPSANSGMRSSTGRNTGSGCWKRQRLRKLPAGGMPVERRRRRTLRASSGLDVSLGVGFSALGGRRGSIGTAAARPARSRRGTRTAASPDRLPE